MKVLYINNDGGGFADYVETADDITVEQFFAECLPGRSESDYLIRVNRQPVSREHPLCDNDRISITPTKIEGATRR